MRRAILCALLAATTGCLTFREIPHSDRPRAQPFPSTIRVTRNDGTVQLLGGALQVGDTIHGVWPTPSTRYSIPISQVRRVEARRFDRRRTLRLGGVVLGAAALVWIWWEMNNTEIYY